MAAELVFDLIEEYEINQGATYRIVFPYKTQPPSPSVVTLYDYEARMQIRPAKGAGNVLYSATSDDHLTVNGAAGTVTLEIPAETTEGFNFRSGYYDIEIVSPSGEVTRYCEGRVNVNPETTKSAD
jgi:uncharacterized protein YfaP (DUF2135 family)